jgi:acyl-CoA synthetase (AMP-forming)/AMP-acid ligase II
VTEMAGIERLFSALESLREKPAILFEGKTYTFGELDRLSRNYACGLAASGVQRGDRVAVFAETSPEVIVALLGHYRLGAVHVPINTRYRGEELSPILEDSGAKAILVRAGSACARVLQGLAPPPAALSLRIWIGEGSAPPDDLAFGRLVETDLPNAQAHRPPVASDRDTAVLIYTSGTAGKSKGVELSFRAIVASTEGVTGLWRFDSEDRLALALPLFHVHGLCLGLHGALLHGQTVLLFERFDAASVVEAFDAAGATVFMGVPTMYVRLLEHMAQRPDAARKLSRGRLFTAGSAALSTDDFIAFEERTGHCILERYGMSETLFTLSNPYEDRRPGTVGLPVPGCEVRIVDEEGREVGEGEPGEILVRGSGLMTGYWRRPAETAASFRDGWFVTGDMARRNRDGYVTIVGRKAFDIIKTGGFKISTREIEDVLRRHPKIKDVAVVGAPDRTWGQKVVAVVVLEEEGGAISEKELLGELSSFCLRHLADYKHPRAVRVLHELPRNALGKVQKHRILESL